MFIQFIKMAVRGTIGALLYVLMQICRGVTNVFGWLQTQACRGVIAMLPKNKCLVTVIEKDEKKTELCKIKIN